MLRQKAATQPTTTPTESKAKPIRCPLYWHSIVYMHSHTTRVLKNWQYLDQRRKDYYDPNGESFYIDDFQESNKVFPWGYRLLKLPEELLTRTANFNEAFDNYRAKPEVRIEHVANALADLIHIIQLTLASPKGSSPGFNLVCPELANLYEIYTKETATVLNPLSSLNHLLDWKTLEVLYQHVPRLYDQLLKHEYPFVALFNPRVSAEMMRLMYLIESSALRLFENFNRWFSEPEVKKHQFSNSHIACRLANQDLEYAVDLLTNNTILNHLKEEIPALEGFLDLYHDKLRTSLKKQRQEYTDSYKKYLDSHYQQRKLADELRTAQDTKHQLEVKINKAVHESFDEKQSCVSALRKIKVLIQYDHNESLSNHEAAAFSKILQYITEAEQAPKIHLCAQLESKPTPSNSESTLTLHQRMTYEELDWDTLHKLQVEIQSLLAILQKESYTILTFNTQKETERLTLIDYIKICIKYMNPVSGYNEETLSTANDALFDLISKMKKSPILTVLLEDSITVGPQLKKLFTKLQQEIKTSIISVRKETYQLQTTHTQQCQSIAKLESELAIKPDRESPLEFYIKQACLNELARTKPYEAATIKILMIVAYIINNEAWIKPSLSTLRKFHSIFTHIDAATSKTASAQPATSNSDRPTPSL